MAHPNAVKRSLHLASPHLRGADIRSLQSAINRQFAHLRIDRNIEVDGQFGAQTWGASRQVALGLGVRGTARRKLDRGTLSEGTQRLIRGRRLTKAEAIVAKARAPFRTRLRKRFAKGPGESAVAKGLRLIGVHESPAGSNWGGKVSQFIRYTGYSGPVYWCGCFACWVVCKLGGAKIPDRIRLGYAPYITADAIAGRNGLTAVPVAKARAGDLGALWGGEHVVVVRGRPRNGMVPTLEGNTSAANGSQSNGGEVAAKERPISDFDQGIVARPAY